MNGVSVVLSGDAENYRGASIAWATKVEQGHALASLPSHTAVTKCIRKSGEFTINVLASDQSYIAHQYGGTSQTDALEIQQVDLDFDQWKIPIVKDARAMDTEITGEPY